MRPIVSRVAALAVGAIGVGMAVTVPAAPAAAHPLGNFTVNTYAGITVEPERVLVDLVVDMAEIPAFQTQRTIDTDGDGQASPGEESAWAGKACTDAGGRSRLTVDGKPAPIVAGSSSVTFPPGAAGLSTLRLSCVLTAAVGAGEEHRVAWQSTAYTDRVGWREVTAVGSGTILTSSDVPTASVSERLTRYPDDLLSSPLDRRSASLRTKVGASGSLPAADVSRDGPVRALPRGIDAAARSFTGLVARRDLTLAFGALAVALAIALGAVHALAPGHGKTVMAAYLVGQRGSLRQAGIIALTVTTTHTIGVLILGLALSASTTLAPESIYPWLGLTSGALLAAVGVGLLRRAVRGRRAHSHVHPHVHATVGGHDHDHGHTHEPLPADAPISRRALVAMGVAGGMVPSPSALVVLLGAMALGRAWFGVVLVVAYGVGMAGTLTAAGLLLVRARKALDRRAATRTTGPARLAWLARTVPAVTASVIVVVGLFLAARGAAQL